MSSADLLFMTSAQLLMKKRWIPTTYYNSFGVTLSLKFDIISPYYTSSQGFDSTFTMTCLQDALLHFEMFSFHVLALIGDGASWNQTRFKCLCGHAGKFGAIEGEGDHFIHDVPESFTNPNTGVRVWCVVHMR